eukprot:1137432-Pelagomonas_calceolata.AAC.1
MALPPWRTSSRPLSTPPPWRNVEGHNSEYALRMPYSPTTAAAPYLSPTAARHPSMHPYVGGLDSPMTSYGGYPGPAGHPH